VTLPKSALPWIALVVVYLMWGSTYLGIRVAVATIPPYLMTGVRFLIAGVLMLALQWAFSKRKPTFPTRAELLQIAIIAVALLAIGNGLLSFAETRVESGTAALLIASSPLFMVLIDAFATRKAPSLLATIGIVLGSIGIAVLVGKSSVHGDAFMAALILFSSLAWAAGSVYARGTTHHPLTAPLEMIVGGALLMVVGLAIGETAHVQIAAISPASVWGMAWLIVGGAMIGYSAYAYAVRTLPTATVATYGYVNPIVAVILGAIVLHEPLTWRVLAGGAAVILSVLLILLGSPSRPTAA